MVITECLALMEAAGLRIYGRRVDALMARAYGSVCELRQVNDPVVMRQAAVWFAAHAREFPTAAEFADRCRVIDEARYDLVGVEGADGCIRIVRVPVGALDGAS